MEESLPQQTQELEYSGMTEEKGGIRRRLRDRELLKKRKAEAEEKETNQWLLGEESPRKRARAETKGRRGRPRKAEILPAQDDGAPAVVVPAPQTSDALTISGTGAQESLPAELPVQGPVLSDVLFQGGPAAAFDTPGVFAPSIPDPAPIATVPADLTPTLAPLSVVADLDPALQAAQKLVNPTPPLDAASVADPVAAAIVDPTPAFLLPSVDDPSSAQEPPLDVPDVSTRADVSINLQKKELIDPVLIEDVGPDVTEDFPSSQEDQVDKDVTPLNTMEQNQKFFMQSSSLPQQQDYPNGN